MFSGIDNGVKLGTMGGTILSLAVSFGDVGRTVVLGIVGATVSFFMSMLLKWTVARIRLRLSRFSSGKK